MVRDFKRVAVLVDTSSGWGRRLIKGVANYALKQGDWQISVEQRGIHEAMKVKEGWKGDGVIARVSDKKLAAELAGLELPLVNVSSIELENFDFPRITTDENAFAKMAVGHFQKRGHTRLAYFSLVRENYSERRGDFFKREAEKKGMSCEVYPNIGRRKKPWEQQRKEIRSWLETLPKPVGILTWDTIQGRHLLNVCQQGGIDVPQEVAVLSGEDDELLSEVCYPAMSGVVASAEKIGHEAARGLDLLMRGGESEGISQEYPPEYVNERLSTDSLAIGDEKLRQAIQFIREYVRDHLQVSDVAEAVGLSRRSLERRFGQVLGCSPAQEIQRFRLDCAKKLLRETDLKIADIAAHSGYCSSEYMTRIFHKLVGKTPLKYRSWIRGQ